MVAKDRALENSDRGLRAWIRERLAMGNLDYQVPGYANTLAFSLGGVTLISFLILVISGIILAQFYKPDPAAANGSLRMLMTQINMGNILRGVHFWAAQVAMVTLILHLLRVFIYGSYKRPREINWLIGVGLFFGMIGLYYTGTVLKWDQEALEALAHTKEVAELAGVFGLFFTDKFAQGAHLLTRMYSIHISLLPLLVVGLLTIHLLLVKGLKISPLPWDNVSSGDNQSFSQHLVNLSGYGLILLGVITILAVLLPPELGPIPVEGIEATKPPWLFLGIFSIENWIGLQGLIWASVLLALGLVAVPIIDRAATNNIKQRKPIVGAGILIVIFALVLTVNGYVAEPEQHLDMGEEVEQVNTDLDNQSPASEDSAEKTDEEEIDSVLAPEIKKLNNALVVMEEIEKAVKANDFHEAVEKAGELDEILDAINAQIAAKDKERAADLKEHVHELVEILEKPQPDLEEANDLIVHTEESVEKAVSLFE